MGRKHFFERLERENNYQNEYEKLEAICGEKYYSTMLCRYFSINSWIESNFRKWRYRSNYCSYEELREQLGFKIISKDGDTYVTDVLVTLNEYLLYCEMLINLIVGLQKEMIGLLEDTAELIVNTIIATIEKAGLEVIEVDGQYMITEKNAVAIEVADANPEIGDIVIEYNHYLLKGDITRKKEILNQLAQGLEPKRKQLTSFCKTMSDDFFQLVNEMNIRHNNCDEEDSRKYNPKFALLSEEAKENWYDLIYEQGLALFVMLKQLDRNAAIEKYKKS